MLPPKSLNIMPIIGGINPDGFFFILLMVIIVGVEIMFLIGAVRWIVNEFREPARIWWKLLIKISLALIALAFVAITIFLWVIW